jgi:hypothetical protein
MKIGECLMIEPFPKLGMMSAGSNSLDNKGSEDGEVLMPLEIGVLG